MRLISSDRRTDLPYEGTMLVVKECRKQTVGVYAYNSNIDWVKNYGDASKPKGILMAEFKNYGQGIGALANLREAISEDEKWFYFDSDPEIFDIRSQEEYEQIKS